MVKNYYAVTAKFGHVGRNKFIIKTVPVEAESGKEAAYQVRWMPRVKHHDKNAIIDVKEIDLESYIILCIDKALDSYFLCHNIQEQREYCPDICEEMQYIEQDEVNFERRAQKRRERINYQKRKHKSFGGYCHKTVTHLMTSVC